MENTIQMDDMGVPPKWLLRLVVSHSCAKVFFLVLVGCSTRTHLPGWELVNQPTQTQVRIWRFSKTGLRGYPPHIIQVIYWNNMKEPWWLGETPHLNDGRRWCSSSTSSFGSLNHFPSAAQSRRLKRLFTWCCIAAFPMLLSGIYDIWKHDRKW